MSLQSLVPSSWSDVLAEEFGKKYFQPLDAFVEEKFATETVYPPRAHIFSAFEAVDYENVKVLMLGQDPYHQPDQAHGLCFSVLPGVKIPPSLRNIYKELHSDLGCSIPDHGYLMHWANQGILMLNAVMTVTDSQPASHKSKGWERFTDAVIKKVNEKPDPVVFLLWGGYARKKSKFVDQERHVVIEGVHPSPLSAKNGFFGSHPFSQVNEALVQAGKEPIDWQIPPV
ncbi:MAG: uracil-DNA glycosylase [Myxococcota bacterium]